MTYKPSANSQQSCSYAGMRPINRQKNTRKNINALPRLFCYLLGLLLTRLFYDCSNTTRTYSTSTFTVRFFVIRSILVTDWCRLIHLLCIFYCVFFILRMEVYQNCITNAIYYNNSANKFFILSCFTYPTLTPQAVHSLVINSTYF